MVELEEGDVVGGFVVKGKLGAGGMGDVYLVHDEKLAVDRALKVIQLRRCEGACSASEAQENRERFLREARTLARLRHPNIIPVQVVDEVDGNPFIVMTHFPSKDARSWLFEDRPSLELVKKVADQVASALAYAHGQGVLHRDLKLSNTLVSVAGDVVEAMLIDFGLAKGSDDADLTRTGRSMGTLTYMAPEYLAANMRGEHPVHTALTDLWAVGCSLYTMTCYASPFSEKDDFEIMRKIQAGAFAPVDSIRTDAAPEWVALVHDLLQLDPAKRVQSAAELVRRLASVTRVVDPAKPAFVPPTPEERKEPSSTKRSRRGSSAPDTRLDGRGPPQVVSDGSVEMPPLVDVIGIDVERRLDDTSDPSVSIFSKVIRQSGARDAVPPSVPTPVVAAADSTPSLFAGVSSEPSSTKRSLPLPAFVPPAPKGPSTQRRALRGLLFPLAAALSVVVIGGALVAVTGAARPKADAAPSFVDPDEIERRRNGERELSALEQEKDARLMPIIVPAPRAEPAREAAPTAAAEAPKEPPPTQHRAVRAPAAPAPKPYDPWAARYGSRTNFNTSSGPPSAPTPAQSDEGTQVAGVRVPVRVVTPIASSPTGPVIAVVSQPTKVGALSLPAGTELHGTTSGTSGSRVLVSFTFAVVNGRNVQLRGSALGLDGRAGVPGAKSLGGASDVAAGGATGAASGAVDALASAVDNGVIGSALRGAGSPASSKLSRLNNEEDLVTTARGARFFVYVEAAG